jgi:FkbM family methyltransferase
MRTPFSRDDGTTPHTTLPRALHAPVLLTNPVMLPEFDLICWARQFLRSDGVFVDAGAHVGSYTLCYAPACREVWAFECQRDVYYRLCAGIVLNDYDNVYAVHGALVDPEALARRTSTEVYRFTADGGGTTTLAEAVPHAGFPLQHVDTALAYTIDQFRLNDVTLIKIDVEGSELPVLRGAEHTLARCRPRVLYEVNPKNAWHRAQDEKVASWLVEHEYRISPIGIRQDMRLAVPA